jgi:hypothetical protein
MINTDIRNFRVCFSEIYPQRRLHYILISDESGYNIMDIHDMDLSTLVFHTTLRKGEHE